MKKTGWILPFFCTVMVLCLGLYMPRIASSVLDYNLRTQIKQMENSNISLTLSENADYFDRAYLFNSLITMGNSSIELSEKSQVCRLLPDEAERIAVETISYIGAYNMARGELVVTPVLFVGTDENSAVQSGVFWCCRWTDSDAQSQVLWLDDESGLMVGLMFENYLYDGSSDDSLSESYTDVPESIDLLVKYCRMYYSADNVEINNEWDGNYSIILTKEQNGVKSVYPISVRLQNNELIFFNV